MSIIPIQQELAVLRGKVAKLEEEKSALTEQNALLTAKTEDLEVHLQEEREHSAQVSLVLRTRNFSNFLLQPVTLASLS